MRKILLVLAFLGILVVVRSDGGWVAAQATVDSSHHDTTMAAQPIEVALDAAPAAAQVPTTDNSHQHDSASGALQPIPVAVDGAKTPERIPDDLAYAHLLTVLAIKSAASPADIGRRKAILATTRLGTNDAQVIVKSLEGVREQLTELDNQQKQLTSDTVGSLQSLAVFASIRSRKETILREARYRVAGALSAEGIRTLDDHIQRRVKPRIVIYGDPR